MSLLLLVLREASRPLGNPDTWFHLRLGAEFIGGWSLSDPGSMTRFATADWTPTQWSMQLLAAFVEDIGGVAAVAWLFGLLYMVFVVAVYLLCRGGSAALPAALVTSLTVFGASASLSARPQVSSLILIAVVLGAWLRTGQDGKPRWWLIPLTWIWATAHGFWSIGVLVGFVCLAGLVMDRRIEWGRAGSLVAVPVLSLAAACLTPVGPQLLTSQFAVAERSDLVTEWAPTTFDQMHAVVGAGMLALLLVLWSRRGGATWTHILLALLAAGFMISAVRLVSIGAILLAPLLAAAVQRLQARDRAHVSGHELLGLGFVTAVACAVLALVVPQTAARPANVPVGFADELSSLPAGTPVMVEAAVGSWVDWRFPELHPTVDGMFDAFPLGYLRGYKSAMELEPGWQETIHHTGAQDAVLTDGSALAAAMTRELGWTQVDVEGRWVYLAKNATD